MCFLNVWMHRTKDTCDELTIQEITVAELKEAGYYVSLPVKAENKAEQNQVVGYSENQLVDALRLLSSGKWPKRQLDATTTVPTARKRRAQAPANLNDRPFSQQALNSIENEPI